MDSDMGEENGGPVSWLVYRCAWVENRWTGTVLWPVVWNLGATRRRAERQMAWQQAQSKRPFGLAVPKWNRRSSRGAGRAQKWRDSAGSSCMSLESAGELGHEDSCF